MGTPQGDIVAKLNAAVEGLKALLPEEETSKGMDGPAGDAPDEDERPKSADAKADDAKAEDAKAEEAKADDAKAEDAKADDGEDDEAKAEDAKAEEAKADDAKGAEKSVSLASLGGESLLAIGRLMEKIESIADRQDSILKAIDDRFGRVETALSVGLDATTEISKAVGIARTTAASSPAGAGLAASSRREPAASIGAAERLKGHADSVPSKWSRQQLLNAVMTPEKTKALHPNAADYYTQHGSWPGDWTENQIATADSVVSSANENQ